jgi:vacuolar-type H+-ATPase subunit E/Vma4
MPLTGKIATVLAQNQKEVLELQRLVREQSETIKKLQNPTSAANQRAFAAMDDSITTTLEGMYGEVPVAFHDAVSQEIEGVIKTLMREAPEKWEQIRRSEVFQKRLVAHCAQKLVPPKARQVMLEKHEAERPTTGQDFDQAIRELDQLKRMAAQGQGPYSAAQLKNMETELRQKAWEFKYNGQRRYNQPDRRRR